MTASKQHESSVPVIKVPAPQRPRTLLQRLSSGVTHVLPAFRALTPKNESIMRPTTAPNPAWKSARREVVLAESEQLLVPEVDVITGELKQHCPYDPNTYHSLASIEERRCSLCGIRGPKIVHSEPCHDCRTGGPGSHMAFGHKHTNIHRRHSTIDPRHLTYLVDSRPSILLSPRPVTPGRAATRIGNPPRVSRLPPGIVRLPVTGATPATQNQQATVRPVSRLGTTSPSVQRQKVSAPSSSGSNRSELMKKPASPRLHHIHGLPHSENFPFVHKHEIPKHAVALRAGSTSPLTDHSNSPASTPTPHPKGHTDYSRTVRYGGKTSPLGTSRDTTPKPHITTVVVKRVRASRNAVVDPQTSPIDATLAGSEVYRNCSPQQVISTETSEALIDATDNGTTFGSQDTNSTKLGGMRLELKGDDLYNGGAPRLRGGSGDGRVSTSTLGYKLKRWLLTCHGPLCPDGFDTDSDNDLPPPRVVSSDRVLKKKQKMNGRAPLPSYMCGRAQQSPPTAETLEGAVDLLPATTFETTISGLPKPSSWKRLSLSITSSFHHQSEFLINHPAQPAPLTATQVLTPPLPHLRGGADSPDKIPPMLFWLAGGTGKPNSFGGWKQSQPKTRMGGLFGMAVFGGKYGKNYEVEANSMCEVDAEVEIESSASIKVVMENGGSVKDNKGGQDAKNSSSSSSSSSGSSSSSTVQFKPVKEPTPNVGDAPLLAVAEPVQRALTTPPTEALDDVPLCSGALPVEPAADLLADGSAPAPPDQDNGEKVKVAAANTPKAEV